MPVPCCGECLVLIAQRNTHDVEESEHHLFAGARAPRFEEADMARRDVGP